ncbi:MAG: helix-turn-helix domain-containing protein [Verrucomicrobia bacterium]|nr:helix-turn-helix domain-containing protein [Verrucomicrobiota bacterium]
MPDGHRVRQNFQDRDDAIAKKAKLGLQALHQPVTLSLKRTRLTDEQLTEAEAAFLKLDGKASLLTAVHHYLLTGQKPITRITVREAHDLFLAAAKNRNFRPRSIQELRSRVGFLVSLAGNGWLDEVSNADVDHGRTCPNNRGSVAGDGRKGGRKPIAAGDPRVQTAKKVYADKSLSIADICKTLRISRATFYRYLATS